MVATEPDSHGLAARRRLLEIARAAIRSQLERGSWSPTDVDDGSLLGPGGAFVSLHIEGRLRGCIGLLESSQPIHRTVAEMAVAAATEDQRFPPLTMAELRHTELEISLLTPMSPISADHVKVGTHGLYIARGRHRGVLLPQVPVQYRWSREQFLAEACKKAGLRGTAWREPETVVQAFTAEVFNEVAVLQATAEAEANDEV